MSDSGTQPSTSVASEVIFDSENKVGTMMR